MMMLLWDFFLHSFEEWKNWIHLSSFYRSYNTTYLLVYVIWVILPYGVLWSSDFLIIIYIKQENIKCKCMLFLSFFSFSSKCWRVKFTYVTYLIFRERGGLNNSIVINTFFMFLSKALGRRRFLYNSLDVYVLGLMYDQHRECVILSPFPFWMYLQ